MGMALGTLTGGAVLAVTGSWRAAFFLFAGPGIGLALLMPHLPDTQIPARRRYFVGVSAVLRSRSLVLAGLAAGLTKLQAKRPVTPAAPHHAPRSGSPPEYTGATFARGLLAAPARFVFLRD